MNGLDLAKIPFFAFVIKYTLIILFLNGICGFLHYQMPEWGFFFLGGYIAFFIQFVSMIARVFCLNQDWGGPILLQYGIWTLTFFINLFVLYFMAGHEKNIPLIIGFFVAYYLNLKIVVLIALQYSRKTENA
jgi:fatty acid desaturase